MLFQFFVFVMKSLIVLTLLMIRKIRYCNREKMMKFQIQQNTLRDAVKRKIFDGFRSLAIESTGINGMNEESISFEIFDGTEFVGAIVVKLQECPLLCFRRGIRHQNLIGRPENSTSFT